MDKVLFLDTDLLFLHDVAVLWQEFDSMHEEQCLAIVETQSGRTQFMSIHHIIVEFISGWLNSFISLASNLCLCRLVSACHKTPEQVACGGAGRQHG